MASSPTPAPATTPAQWASPSPTANASRPTPTRTLSHTSGMAAGAGCMHIGSKTKTIIDRLKVLVPYAYVCKHRQALLQGRRGATTATVGTSVDSSNREPTPAPNAGPADGDRSRKRLVEEMPAPTCYKCSTPADRLHVCLSCDFFGCWRTRAHRQGHDPHIVAHLHQSNHPFALDFAHLQVYCRECADYVYDTTIAGWLMGTHMRWHAALCDSAESEAKRPRIVSTGADLSPLQTKYLREHGSVSPCTGVRGLYNLGATCYLSVVLQALVHNPLMRGWMLSDGHHPSKCRVGRAAWARSQLALARGADITLDGAAADMAATTAAASADRDSDQSDDEEILSGRVGGRAGGRDSPDTCMACEFEASFQAFFSDGQMPLGPVRLLRTLWLLRGDLAGYGQQDAHECLVAMLDTLHVGFTENVLTDAELAALCDARGDTAAQPLAMQMSRTVQHTHLSPCPCLVHQVFAGVLQSTVTCAQCGNTTHAHDPILDISLDIPPPRRAISPDQRELATSYRMTPGCSFAARATDAALGEWMATRHQQKTPSGSSGSGAWKPPLNSMSQGRFPVVTLQDCLDHYTRPEQLSPGSYVCSRCRSSSAAATKQLCIKELPPVLTFQLKRFGHDPHAKGSGSSNSGGLAGLSFGSGGHGNGNGGSGGSGSGGSSGSSGSSAKIDTFVRLPLQIDMTPYTASAQASHAQAISGLRASGGAATSSTGNALPATIGDVPVRDLGAADAPVSKTEECLTPGINKDTPVPVLDGPGGSTSLGKRRTDATHSNPSCIYKLFAVIDHIGLLDTGHYTAYAQHRNQWYKFDDAVATKVDTSEVLGFAEEAKVRSGRAAKGKAYMAFYVKTVLDYHDGAATLTAGSQVGSASPTALSTALGATGMGATNTRVSESGEWIEDAGIVRTRTNLSGDLKIERRGRKKGSTNAVRKSKGGDLQSMAGKTSVSASAARGRKKKSAGAAMDTNSKADIGELDEFMAAGTLDALGSPSYVSFDMNSMGHADGGGADDSDSDGEALWAQMSKEKAVDDLVPMVSPLAALDTASLPGHIDPPLFINPAELYSSPPPQSRAHELASADYDDPDDYDNSDSSDFAV